MLHMSLEKLNQLLRVAAPHQRGVAEEGRDRGDDFLHGPRSSCVQDGHCEIVQTFAGASLSVQRRSSGGQTRYSRRGGDIIRNRPCDLVRSDVTRPHPAAAGRADVGSRLLLQQSDR
jgi:hypothetical protein